MQTLFSSPFKNQWGFPVKWIIGAFILMTIAVMYLLDLPSYLTIASLVSEREQLLAWAHDHYALTVLLFIGFSCLTTALAIPIDIVVALAGGYLFGSIFGTAYVILGATGGAILAFLGSRYWFFDSVGLRFGTRFPGIHHSVSLNGFGYLVALRLIPLIPFTAINLLAGLTPMKLRTFAAGTILGIFPCSFILVHAGHQLGSSTSMAEVFSLSMVLALSAFGLLAFLAIAFQQQVIGKPFAIKVTRPPESGKKLFRIPPSFVSQPGKDAMPGTGEPHVSLS